jgi:hypothetical protein
MKTKIRLIAVLLILGASAYGRTIEIQVASAPSSRALNYEVVRFDLTDSTLVEGLSKLSSEPIVVLHLGIEEILREKFSEPRDRSVRFSLTLEHTTVRDIIDTLCQFDSRYTWSTDGSSINVYPQQIVGNSSYLLNRDLEQITLKNISRPEDALTPLTRLLPGEQLGFASMGGDSSYSEPRSAEFNDLTVRQLMNRLAEHIDVRGGWILSGSNDQRFFSFFRLGFHE